MTHPSVNSIVERLQTMAACLPEQRSIFTEAATIISELQAENERLQRALMFWMPGVDLRLDEATREQCANDAGLLAGYSGPLAGRRWGNEIIDTVANLQAENGRLTREIQSEKDESDTYCKWWREEQEVTRNIKARLTGAESSLSRIKEETIEACARIADPPLMHRVGQPGLWRRRRAAIASAIRSLGSTRGGDAEEGSTQKEGSR